MSKRRPWLSALLVVAALILVATTVRVVLDWENVSGDLVEALDRQTAKTEATLFRLGEALSIGAALKTRFGVEPDVTYDTDTGVRTLGLSFDDYAIPETAIARNHAREIATFAVAQTTKADQIDTVVVRLESTGPNGSAVRDAEFFSFARAELVANEGARAGSPMERPTDD